MEVVIVLGGPNTKENIKALLENRYGKAYEDFRFVGVDGGALRLLDQHLSMEVAIGDFDSVTKEQRDLIHEAAGTVVQLPSEKDDTDFIMGEGALRRDTDSCTRFFWRTSGPRD